jgi:hypothetical protein
MSGSGVVHPTPAQKERLWRELHVLNFDGNLGGRDKRLRGAVHSWPGRSLDSQGFLRVDFEVHILGAMCATNEDHADLGLCRDVWAKFS